MSKEYTIKFIVTDDDSLEQAYFVKCDLVLTDEQLDRVKSILSNAIDKVIDESEVRHRLSF